MRRPCRSFACLLASAILLSTAGAGAAALGSAFVYQGRLDESGQPATGLFDLQVCLFDSPGGPLPLACVPDFDDVPVEDGLFAITLDFGSAPFAGEERYLELRVRPGDSTDGYTILAPRQIIRPAPEALRAAIAPWAGLSGVPAGFADDTDNDSGGTVTSIATGAGLIGGPINDSGTLAIDSTQVQSRVSGECPLGSYLRGINADGSVLCSDLPGVVNNSAVETTHNIKDTSIAIGADGLPLIGYYNVDSGTLRVAKCANAACTGTAKTSTVDDAANIVGEFPSIAVGADGLPVISYFDATASALKVAKCTDSACSDPATITTVDDPSNAVGSFTSMAIAGDGLPVISYYDATDGALKVARCNDAACSDAATINTIDGLVDDVGEYNAIAIGADGLPVISYYNSSQGLLKVAKCVDAACSDAATITAVDNDPTNNVGEFTAIAIGADGLPVVSYRSPTLSTLKVAKCGDDACSGPASISTVDGIDDNVGSFTAIAIGADGLPVISYHDQTAGALKVAKCIDPACSDAATLTTVDNPANIVGTFTSIAIGVDGLPVISYRDASSGDLKAARCGSPSCK